VYAVAAAVAFLLELCALAALGYWGAYAGNGAWAYVLAAATPLAAAIVWGMFAAPRARFRLADRPKVAVRLVVLLGSAVALACAGREWLALAMALLTVADVAILAALGRPVAGAG
jgi:hypothetical protein